MLRGSSAGYCVDPLVHPKSHVIGDWQTYVIFSALTNKILLTSKLLIHWSINAGQFLLVKKIKSQF